MRKTFAIILLLASAALFGVGYFSLKRSSKTVPPEQTPSAGEFRERLKQTQTSAKRPAVETRIVYVTNQFNWSQVESSDYREYIANLRAIGCPEPTIKDIILTDILKLYATQRGQYYHNGREFRFWETDEKRKLTAKQLEQREKQLAAIDKEIPAVLRELLGINYEREMNKYFVDTNEDERRLSFLPEERRNQLLALRDQIEGMRERVYDRANGNLSDKDVEELRSIEAHRKAQLEKLLSRAELAEFELRTSPVADRLRADLIGFNPSESEFREIFELQNAFEERYALADVNNAAVEREKAAAEAEIQETLKRQLSEARYAQYLQAQNPDFRNACIFTEVYELPISTAQALYEIKQIAETEKQNLLQNPGLSESARLEVLQAIQAETEKALRETLGANVFAKYSQGTGKWVQNLGSEN